MFMVRMLADSMKLPATVRVWMVAMMVLFAAHAFYLDNPLIAISFAGFFTTVLIFAPIAYVATNTVDAIALSHFVLWPAMLINGVIAFSNGTINIATAPGALLIAATPYSPSP